MKELATLCPKIEQLGLSFEQYHCEGMLILACFRHGRLQFECATLTSFVSRLLEFIASIE